MGNRSVEIFQTRGDVKRIIEQEETRLGEPLLLFSSEPAPQCPQPIRWPGGVEPRTFCLTRSRFVDEIDCRPLPTRGTAYIGVLNSPVILVEPSHSTQWSLDRGRYWYCTHRIRGERLEPKDSRFIKWAESFLRLVRAKATYWEAFPPYKYWFAPEAERWIRTHDGVWALQSKYWTSDFQGPIHSILPLVASKAALEPSRDAL